MRKMHYDFCVALKFEKLIINYPKLRYSRRLNFHGGYPLALRAKLDERLFAAHALHAGVYRRVANKLGVDASYVSRVAGGKRHMPRIRLAILEELRRIQSLLE